MQITKEELGGWHIHARNGSVDNLAESEEDAFAQVGACPSVMVVFDVPRTGWRPGFETIRMKVRIDTCHRRFLPLGGLSVSCRSRLEYQAVLCVDAPRAASCCCPQARTFL